MYTPLPKTSEEFEHLTWLEIEPWYRELLATPLVEETLQPWLIQWSHLSELIDETLKRHEIACTQNTADQKRVQRRQLFLDMVYAPIQSFDQQIKQQLLASELEPSGFAIPLRNLRTEATLFREDNLPLLNEEKSLTTEYYGIGGAQTVIWEGKESSITSLSVVLNEPDRQRREQAWRLQKDRQLANRDSVHAIWVKQLQLRQHIALNAGYTNYRDYRWRQLLRFNYTPADCLAFHEAVEQIIVPAGSQLWEKHRHLLEIETVRPWDMRVNPYANRAPRLIADVNTVLPQCATVFQLIHPQLGTYFETMIQEQLFDLEERPSKAHVGYNLPLEVKQRPFVFGHVKSVKDIVPLIFHEAGHAFHVFEMSQLPYIHQRKEEALPLEFAEVASTSMEFIGAMYLHQAGICTATEAAQIRIQHLENILLNYLPIIICGDAFQHWVYEHPEQATDLDTCGEKWAELNKRYQPMIDWSGLDVALKTDWQWISHFFDVPFYFIEYAFAALGALQIWDNYQYDANGALQHYRDALSLGATKTLPELYTAAGAKFVFDQTTLQRLLQLILRTLDDLEGHV